jgi:FtsH-binding integral membrane protein
MSDYDRGVTRPAPAGTADMAVDVGLRAFMLGIYNKMMLGLVLAAGIAWVCGNVPDVTHQLIRYLGAQPVGYTPLGWLVAFAPLGLIIFSGFFMRRMSPVTSALLYWTVVALIGASMGVLFLLYTGVGMATTFLITAAAFGGLSLFGYATKKDLSGFGSFLIMGVWGLIITSLVVMFVPGLYANPAFALIFNGIGVLLFSGLIAWKTQYLKMSYYQMAGDRVSMAVATNLGALSLFISFVNLFRFLLFFMGGGGGRR